jgi:dTDP-3-amino-3,4,6-trideoxy-alpha-D-glucose transaminase
MRIPFADLKRGTEALRSDLDAAASRVLDSGWYVLGEEGRAFEAEFAAYTGSRHAVGVASGTDAIEVALRALGVGPGDEVVTQANTCVPTVSGIERTGAAPVLCDVEEDGATMDVESLRSAIGPRTRAIVPVHLYGQCADVDAILEAAGDIPLVEDCAQAHGAELRGRRAGSMGALGCFSFYPTKNLGALGDGGAVTTDDDGLAERLRLVRQYGQTGRYHHVERGVNSRLDELQAAILRAKLPHLDAWNQRRREIAAAYDDALRGTPARPLDRLPERLHAFHLYVVEVPERDALQAGLAEAGVGTLVHYPEPVHGHPPYCTLGEGPVALGVAERLASRIVSLPLYPELTDTEVEHVARSLREVLAARSVSAR